MRRRRILAASGMDEGVECELILDIDEKQMSMLLQAILFE
jgi:hypothetical protein